jgi:hypothetical protein
MPQKLNLLLYLGVYYGFVIPFGRLKNGRQMTAAMVFDAQGSKIHVHPVPMNVLY